MQYGFYFDQTRCTGCFACVVVCRDWHDVTAGPVSWMRVKTIEAGMYPDPYYAHIAIPCYHCANPRCVAVCPTGAIVKREDGVVVVDRDKCRTEPGCGIIIGQEFGKQQSPCKIACPAHLSASAYVALIARGKFKEALDFIREQIPLPGVVGRVCHHPCELVCKRQDVDEPIAICELKRFISDHVVDDPPNPISRNRKEKIAIVGSGPAGLSAAYFLVKKGYGVTVFEALPEAGGMLTSSIPEFRLPKDVVKREISYIKDLGVEFRTNVTVGKDIPFETIQKDYQAIFLAIGNQLSRKIKLDGDELSGILWGLDFLRDINLKNRVKVNGKVVVIGGGNVAVDVALSALRLGAKEVQMACLERADEIPANKEELNQAKTAGIVIHEGWGPQKIVCNNGKKQVTGIELVCCTSVFDIKGNFNPSFDVQTIKSVSADMIILAIGQAPDLSMAPENLNITDRGTVQIDSVTMETSIPGVFAGGDVVTGPGYVINAIVAGRQAADSIDRSLQNLVTRMQPITLREAQATEWGDAAEVKVEIPAGITKQARQQSAMRPLQRSQNSFNEVNAGFTEAQAIEEAKRCLNCAGHLCLEVCPYAAPQFGTEENAKMQKCDLCVDRLVDGHKPICVESCYMRALDVGPMDELIAKYGDINISEGFVFNNELNPSLIQKPRKNTRDCN